MTSGQAPGSWAAEVAREVRRYRWADLFGPRVRLVDVDVRDGRFWVVTRNAGYAGPVGLVRRVEAMRVGFEPALDPPSAAEILVHDASTPPEPERLTLRDGVSWWGELPGG